MSQIKNVINRLHEGVIKTKFKKGEVVYFNWDRNLPSGRKKGPRPYVCVGITSSIRPEYVFSPQDRNDEICLVYEVPDLIEFQSDHIMTFTAR